MVKMMRHICLLVACAILGSTAVADEPTAKSVTIDIHESNLPDALIQFTQQTGLQLIFPAAGITEHSPVPHLSGTYPTRVALDKLLKSSGLQYEFISPRTIAIRVSMAAGASGAANSSKHLMDDGSNGQSVVAQKSVLESLQLAQSAETSTVPASANNTGNESELAEVVVTAQRRQESLDKVPMSITAFSQKTMDELNIQSFSDLASVVPGLVLTTPGSNVQSQADVAIRGIFSGGNAPTTGIYIDETPIVIRQSTAAGYSGSPQPDIFDLDRIEVLRGPQGTLFGSGAMGGAIRYVTPQPNLNYASGYSKAEFGYTDRGSPSYAIGLAYGAPIVQDTAGFRLSGWFHSDGGFIDIQDPFTGQIVKRNANSSDSYVLRPAFTVVPMEGLTITPAVFIQHHHSDEPDEYWRTDAPNPEQGAKVSGFGATVPQPVTDDLSVSSLAIKYDFRNMSFQSDTSYTDRSYHDFDDWSNYLLAFFGLPNLDREGIAGFSSYDENIQWTRAWQQEFRLSSQDPSSRLTWVVGAYYRHALDGISQLISPDLTPVLGYLGFPNYVSDGQQFNSYTRFTTITEQKAVFGDISYELLSHLKVSAGLRVERSTVEQQHQILAGPLTGTAYTNIILPDEAQTPVTPKFAVTYQYTDNDMVYASAAKGFREGGSNSPAVTDNPACATSLAQLGLPSAPSTFNSDSLWSYEIGAKDSFLGKRLAIQTSLYYIDWSNIQTSVGLYSCNGESFTANRGKAVSQGFDVQFDAVLMEGLRFGGSVGYDNAYHPNALYGTYGTGTPPLLIGAGDKLAGVPPWSASTRLEYSRDISRLWDGARTYVRVDYRWLGAYPKSNPNVADYDPGLGPYPNEAYGILNFRLGVIRGGLDFSAFINNATNSDPLLALTHAAQGDPLYSATAIRPLTAGVTALYRF